MTGNRWQDHVRINVAAAIGVSVDNPAGRWDIGRWNDAAAVWSGLVPALVPIECEVQSLSYAAGRDRPHNRFGPATLQLVLLAASELFDPNTSPVDPDTLTLRPGRIVVVTFTHIASGVTYPLGRFWIDAIDLQSERRNVTRAAMACRDGMASLAAIDPLEQPPAGAGETTGERIHRILDEANWPQDWRNVATGQVTVQSTNLARNLADEAGVTADSEGGFTLIGRTGMFVFRDRDFLRLDDKAVTPQFSLVERRTEAPTIPDVCYQSMSIVHSASDVINEVVLGRANGTARRWLSDQSIGLYGRRTFQRTDLICEHDSQIDPLAERMLALYSRLQVRPTSATVNALADPTIWPVLLAADLNWRTTVYWSDDANTWRGVTDCFIQRVTHNVNKDEWMVGFSLWDASAFNPGAAWDEAVWDEAVWSSEAGPVQTVALAGQRFG